MDIVLSYPFSGALYAFFTEQETGKKLPNIDHPYYKTLYGKNYNEVRDLALTQLLMYEKTYIIPADNHMPDMKRYYSGDSYVNNELGLYSDWKDFNTLRDEIEDQVPKDLEDSRISKILQNVPDNAKRQIITDSRLEISLANKYNCPILSSGGRNKIIHRLSEIDQNVNSANQVDEHAVVAIKKYLDIMSLTFNATNYDLLYTYKQDSELRLYAKEFHNILANIDTASDPRKEILKLIQESMNKEKLMKKSSGILDITSVLLSISGFIPVIGPFLSGGGLLATAGSKALDHQASRTWYEFGPRINKINDLMLLEKQIELELKNS